MIVIAVGGGRVEGEGERLMQRKAGDERDGLLVYRSCL